MFSCCSGKLEEGVLAGGLQKIQSKFKKSIIKIFEERLHDERIKGKKPAIHFSERSMLTYNQLNAFASCLARNIIERLGYNYKVENPDLELVIAICLPMSEKSIAMILGILKTGAAYLPLDPQFPEDLLLQILSAFKPVLLITDDNGKIFNKYDVDKFSSICKICSLEELWLDTDFVLEPKTRRASMDRAWDIDVLETPQHTSINERPVAIIYSHGLHNNPMGVRLSNKSILNLVMYHWKEFKMTKKDVCCVTASIASCISIPQIFIPLLLGCTLHLFKRSEVTDMDNFVKIVSWRCITRLSMPTHHLSDFLDSIDFLGKDTMLKSLKSLKVIICRGTFISLENAKWFFGIFKHGVLLGNSIGAIETTGEIAVSKYDSLKDFESKLVTGRPALGAAVHNTKIYILDNQLQILLDGQGEICVSGHCLAMGYVNEGPKGGQGEGSVFVKNPHSAGPIFDRLYRTGEYGRMAKATNGKKSLYLEGRHDSYVKVRGNVFSTDDVTEFLKDFPCVADAYVFVSHAGKRNQEIIGFVSLKKNLRNADIPTSSEFTFTLRNYLPEWAIPDEIKIIHRVPIHGVEKTALLCPYCLIQIFHKEREPGNMEWDIVKLRGKDSDATKTLLRAIFKYCSVPITSVADNLNSSFYQLGGNSLNTMAVLLFLNQNGYAINIEDFLDAANLKEVIRIMSSKKTEFVENVPVGQLRPEFYMSAAFPDKYILAELLNKPKDAIIQLLSLSYAHKDEFQDYDLISVKDFEKFFNASWQLYVGEDSMSLTAVVDNADKTLVGVLLAYDFFTTVDLGTAAVREMIQETKGLCVNYVPHYFNETLEIAWLGTAESLSPQENIRVVTILLHGIITRTQEKGYSGIFAVVHNQLIRDLCVGVFGFLLLDDYQANKYVDKRGTRPYHLADDTVAAGVCYLSLKEFKEPDNPVCKVDPKQIFFNVKGSFTTAKSDNRGENRERKLIALKTAPTSVTM